MNSNVCFVVVTYNGMKWINRCLSSMYENSCQNIILVDNASNDETVTFVKERFPEVKLIELNQNKGFGAANNIGIKLAMESGCDHVFLLNQDAYLENGALAILLNTINANPEIGIVSPVHLNGSKNGFDKSFSNYLSWMDDHAFLNDLYFNKLKEIYEISFVNAAAWLISRKCIEKIGLFDSIFYHYGEDDNYCQRVRYHGMKIVICTKAIVLHDREDRKGEVHPKFKKDQFIRGKLIQMCNPFNNAETEIRRFLRSQQLEMAKSIFQLDFNKLKEANNAYSLIRRKKKEIINSSRQNKLQLT